VQVSTKADMSHDKSNYPLIKLAFRTLT